MPEITTVEDAIARTAPKRNQVFYDEMMALPLGSALIYGGGLGRSLHCAALTVADERGLQLRQAPFEEHDGGFAIWFTER